MRLDDQLTATDEQAIHKGLTTYGNQCAPPRNYHSLSLVVRNSEGRAVAGLLGSTIWDWLQVDALWVEESMRGRGFGTRLLAEAEQRALARGCGKARLDTFDFEARSFYEERGYVVYAELVGFPDGHRQFHMYKVMGEGAAT
ncbi:MAG: GNAT family N-acetyltransferase [Pyrinomonadaceae bacterium]